MERRKFIQGGVSAGVLAGAAIIPSSRAASAQKNPRLARMSPLTEKVKLAMLTMQRMAWEQGVAAQALLEMGETDLVVLMAREAVIRIWDDGRLGQVCDNHGVTDPGSNGEAVLYAARVTGDPKLKAAADRMLDYFLHKAPKTGDGTLYHIDDKPQVWVDSMYMAPPFLAVAGAPAEAVKQVEGIRRLLWNPKARLFSHIWDDARRDFGRKDFWGVGNGWAAAGMTRIIGSLPDGMKTERARLIGYVGDVLDGCLAHQRPDGLFHDVVDKPSTFVETNLAQILAYCVFRGVKGGWLDRAYLPRAEKMRAAARAKVDREGLVQGVCGSPTFEAPGTATEGQAFFLLMEAAAADLEA
jgi:unsaturated rhamnogalacturonyl hydrolase